MLLLLLLLLIRALLLVPLLLLLLVLLRVQKARVARMITSDCPRGVTGVQTKRGDNTLIAPAVALRAVSCPSGVAAPQPIGCYYYLLSRLGSTPRPGTQTNEPDAHGWGILPGQTYAKLMEQMRCGWGVLPGQIHTRQARG